jgi:tripartite-type tricarboxylate transporter receptor subunit TctC
MGGKWRATLKKIVSAVNKMEEVSMLPVNRLALQMLAAILLATTAPAVRAQDYPSRPITIVVPLAAGSGVDLIARVYGDKLSKRFGKPVIVENRPGAATMIGTNYVATSQPDGHTLLAATSSAMAINPTLYKTISYDPARDFVPINFYLKSPFVLCVNPSITAKSLAELIKQAKQRDKPYTFGSPGAGTAQHLSVEYLKSKFAVDMTHVPYRSNPQYVADVVSGTLDLAFIESATAAQLIMQGKVRGLASSTATRLATLPTIPTLAEAAGDPDIETVSWHMLFAPAATPKKVVDLLHRETKSITTTPEFSKLLLDRGQVPVDSPPVDGIKSYIKSEQDKWGSLVRKLGLAGSL